MTAGKSNPKPKAPSGLTKPGELYVTGDSLPVPEVIEKDSDSAWALWSDAVEQTSEDQLAKKAERQARARDDADDEDYGPDTIPMTEIMDLPETPKERK